MPPASSGPRCNRRRQGRGKNKARGVGADGITTVAACGNVTAHETEALCQRPLDDVDHCSDALPLGDTAAAGPIEPDRMHLVAIGERPVLPRELADFAA